MRVKAFLRNAFFMVLRLFPLVCLTATGCGKKTAAPVNSEDFRVVEKKVSEQNIQVPRSLWAEINGILEESGISDEALNAYVIYPANIAVEVLSVDEGVLKDNRPHKIIFSEGGGELDLFPILTGKGRFRLRMIPSLMNDEPFHLLYVSESPGKQLGTQYWGQGCGRVMDLSQNAESFFGDDGFLLSTGKQHYLHLLAGYFIVFQMVEDRLLLGYVRVKDSRYPQFHCSP